MAARTKNTVGIVGIPPLSIIRDLEARGDTVYDLDEPIVQKDIECASPFLPRVYCAILRTVIVNCLTLNPEEIYIDVGPGKCDCAMHTATILADILPSSRIIRTINQDRVDFGTPVCTFRRFLGGTAQRFFLPQAVSGYNPYLWLDPLHGKQDPGQQPAGRIFQP